MRLTIGQIKELIELVEPEIEIAVNLRLSLRYLDLIALKDTLIKLMEVSYD